MSRRKSLAMRTLPGPHVNKHAEVCVFSKVVKAETLPDIRVSQYIPLSVILYANTLLTNLTQLDNFWYPLDDNPKEYLSLMERIASCFSEHLIGKENTAANRHNAKQAVSDLLQKEMGGDMILDALINTDNSGVSKFQINIKDTHRLDHITFDVGSIMRDGSL